jgi:citrate lyase beta subunit
MAEAAGGVSSAIVFHPPQLSHLPAHFAVTAAQLWQT